MSKNNLYDRASPMGSPKEILFWVSRVVSAIVPEPSRAEINEGAADADSQMIANALALARERRFRSEG